MQIKLNSWDKPLLLKNAGPPIPSYKPIVVARVITIAQFHENIPPDGLDPSILLLYPIPCMLKFLRMKVVNRWCQAKVTFVQNISSLTHLLEERKTNTSVKNSWLPISNYFNLATQKKRKRKKKENASLQLFRNLKEN